MVVGAWLGRRVWGIYDGCDVDEDWRGDERQLQSHKGGREGRKEILSLCDFFFSDFYTNLFVYLLYMKRNLLEEENGVCVYVCFFSLTFTVTFFVRGICKFSTDFFNFVRIPFE